MSCEYCKYKGAVDLFNDDGDKVVTICGHNFCPMCGMPHDGPKPLTLDELREMIGRPAWVEWIGDFRNEKPGWEIVGKGCPIPSLHTLDFRYGETWLAYPHKPKEGNDG